MRNILSISVLILLSCFVVMSSLGGCKKKPKGQGDIVDCDEISDQADSINSLINQYYVLMQECRGTKSPEECDKENLALNAEIEADRAKLQALATQYALGNCDPDGTDPFPTPLPQPTTAPDFPDDGPRDEGGN